MEPPSWSRWTGWTRAFGCSSCRGLGCSYNVMHMLTLIFKSQFNKGSLRHQWNRHYGVDGQVDKWHGGAHYSHAPKTVHNDKVCQWWGNAAHFWKPQALLNTMHLTIQNLSTVMHQTKPYNSKPNPTVLLSSAHTSYWHKHLCNCASMSYASICYASVQICKYAKMQLSSMQVCCLQVFHMQVYKYASNQYEVCKHVVCKYASLQCASMQSASMQCASLQYASMQVCSVQVCSMQVCKYAVCK